MISFETQLKEFKYLVLKEVISLVLNDKLNKNELDKIPYKIIDRKNAEYRCCVYRERAILYEKMQLATGSLPDEIQTNDLVDITNKDQIIYVISAACDRCPINRFT